MGKKDEMSDDIMLTVSVGSRRSGKRKAVLFLNSLKVVPVFQFSDPTLGSEDELSFINFFACFQPGLAENFPRWRFVKTGAG